MRIGIGYDVHQCVMDGELIIGGIEIPFEMGLLGHSDADVLLHSIIDALLGALNLGDIGTIFPSSEKKYKDISSVLLLKSVGEMVSNNHSRIINIDSTVVAQRPRLMGYMNPMRMKIAKTLSIPVESISVKATTTDHLGFEGEGKGISAQAVVLLEESDEP